MGRFFEPSTWAGIGTILATVQSFVPGVPGVVVACLGAACGAVAIKLRERGYGA